MKIIEALKEIKNLQRKADGIKEKVGKHSAYLNVETPVYPDQKGQVREWVQAYSDVLKEILRLRLAIQKTNLVVDVTIEIAGKPVTKSIAAWVHRRRDLAKLEATIWQALTDRGLREGQMKQSTEQIIDVKIIRCYDPKERDEKLEIFQSEPLLIDSRLEVVNAVTDLIEN